MKRLVFSAFALSLILAGSATLSGCGSDECRAPYSEHVFWWRDVRIVQAESLFVDASHPFNTQLGTLPYYYNIHVYHTHPSERLETDVKKVPRAIRLNFNTVYSGSAATSWVEEGFFGNDTTDWSTSKALYLYHEILFEPDSMAVGEYSFNLSDTTDARRKISMWVVSLGWPQNAAPTLAPLELKGTISVQQVFTHNSGKFSYSLDATYASGQKSSFEGTVEFHGVIKDVDCGMSGP
jgi:hypothetical protein